MKSRGRQSPKNQSHGTVSKFIERLQHTEIWKKNQYVEVLSRIRAPKRHQLKDSDFLHERALKRRLIRWCEKRQDKCYAE